MVAAQVSLIITVITGVRQSYYCVQVRFIGGLIERAERKFFAPGIKHATALRLIAVKICIYIRDAVANERLRFSEQRSLINPVT